MISSKGYGYYIVGSKKKTEKESFVKVSPES